MTPQLQQRLTALRALLNEIIENAEKATDGEWNIHPSYTNPELLAVDSDMGAFVACSTYVAKGTKIIASVQMMSGAPQGGFPTVDNRTEMLANARFIAQSRTTSPQMARALLSTLDNLEKKLSGLEPIPTPHLEAPPTPRFEELCNTEDAIESILKEFGV